MLNREYKKKKNNDTSFVIVLKFSLKNVLK